MLLRDQIQINIVLFANRRVALSVEASASFFVWPEQVVYTGESRLAELPAMKGRGRNSLTCPIAAVSRTTKSRRRDFTRGNLFSFSDPSSPLPSAIFVPTISSFAPFRERTKIGSTDPSQKFAVSIDSPLLVPSLIVRRGIKGLFECLVRSFCRQYRSERSTGTIFGSGDEP